MALVPSIVALVLASQVKRLGSAGASLSSLAAAGRAKVLGIVGIFTSLIVALFVIGAVVGASELSATDYTTFQPGQCFNRTPTGSVVQVKRISCSQPHNAEAIGRITVPAGPWPGTNGFQGIVGQACDDDAFRYVQGDLGPNITVGYIYPQQGSWSSGNRLVLCDLRTLDGSKVDGPLGGQTTAT